MIFCAYCYKTKDDSCAAFQRCKSCEKRLYCSPGCMRRDWKQYHSYYCNKSGEIDVDYKIVDVEGKGKGVIALRDFEKYEVVAVERPILRDGYNIPDVEKLTPHEIAAMDALFPPDATREKKFAINHMGGELYLTLSRFNHRCMPTCARDEDKVRHVELMIASRKIRKGEEMTISYVNAQSHPHDRRMRILSIHEFTCDCEGCHNEYYKEKLQRLSVLKELSPYHISSPQVAKQAIKLHDETIAIFEALEIFTTMLPQMYFENFEACNTMSAMKIEAKKYIDKAVELIEALRPSDHPDRKKFKQVQRNPERHPSYRTLDNYRPGMGGTDFNMSGPADIQRMAALLQLLGGASLDRNI